MIDGRSQTLTCAALLSDFNKVLLLNLDFSKIKHVLAAVWEIKKKFI